MRKPRHLALSLLFPAILLVQEATCQLMADTYQNAGKTKSATFYYIYDEVYGFTSRNENGEVVGILVDMMKSFESYIEEKDGIKVTSEFIYPEGGNFDLFMKKVRTGRGGVFGLSNISISDERKKNFDFSPPYLENVSVLLSNQQAPTLKNLNDIAVAFEGMTAYTLSSSTYHERLLEIKNTHFSNMEIVKKNKMGPILDQLKNNNKAFGVMDLNVYLEALQKKWPVKRHAVGDKKGDKFGIIMPKGCDWEPLLNDFMINFYGSTTYREIISRHLGGSALKLINSVNN